MYTIVDGLARLMAPILPVTADELWRYLPGRREESVHLADFPQGVEALVDERLLDEWAQLIRIREEVNAAIEQKRQDKLFGNSLAARVTIRASGSAAMLLERYRAELPTIFIVSEVVLEPLEIPAGARDGAATTPAPDATVLVEVQRANGVRCDRCWRYVPAVSDEPAHIGICPRCGEARRAAGDAPPGRAES